MRRPLSDREREEWTQFMRQIGARPFKGVAAFPPEVLLLKETQSAAPTAPKLSESTAPAIAAPQRPLRHAAPPLVIGGVASGLDHSSWEKLRAGKLRPQRKLDLHGLTAQGAFRSLTEFIYNARRDGLRTVEIVTGRGGGVEGGVLRRELPHWLNLPQFRPLILAATFSSRTNEGAVRLLLRRPK